MSALAALAVIGWALVVILTAMLACALKGNEDVALENRCLKEDLHELGGAPSWTPTFDRLATERHDADLARLRIVDGGQA